MEKKIIYKLIDNADIVSFDIFDTLLVRIARSPKDVFNFLELDFNNFFNTSRDVYNDRILAEEEARNNSDFEEVTFNEIYDCMNGYSLEEINWLKEKELSIEDNILKFNPKISSIYNYCIKKNKKIIIESDMYLPYEFIVKVLNKNKIKFEKLYLSSDILKTKHQGSMFDYMIKTENINPRKVLHIGDSIKSDFIMARKKNIKSFLINKSRLSKSSFDFNTFNSFVSSKYIFNDDVYSNLGFNILGPFYFSFSNWLLKKFEENNIDNVFFLSRDGFVMKKAFDAINNTSISSKYLYVSRKSLIVPALYYCNEFEQMLDLTNIEVLKEFNYELFLNKIGLNPIEVKGELDKFNLLCESKLFGDKLREDMIFREFYHAIKDKIVSNSKIRLDCLLQYLKNNNFCGKLAIVDIGWQGTMQKSLELILKESDISVEIHGFYVGVKKSGIENFNNMNMYGFVFDPINNSFENKLFSFGGLFEYFYSNTEGSVLYYDLNGPVLDSNEYSNNKYLGYMTNIQNAGLDYVNITKMVFDYYKIFNYHEFAILNVIKFGTKCKRKYLNAFADLYYSNLQNFYLLPQHNIFYYIFRIKEFKKDLNQSFWKIGFLKKLFVFPFPYYSLYSFLKKR